jgi:signal transduction histidine kinase
LARTRNVNIKNAIEANEQNPDCRISINAGISNDNFPEISVCDNGPGIQEENIENIFVPFFTTRTDGTGLGLATCLKNVQYHGGSIEVHSELGHGTTFVVTIPLICHI